MAGDPVEVGQESQIAFAEPSVCDRIRFADAVVENRTADVPSREKGSKASHRSRVGLLRSGFASSYRENRAFLAFSCLISADFLFYRDCVAEREGFEPRCPVLRR
jgi:hypothetical protein